MEKYTMFMDWKNPYSENVYTTLSNLQIQCNPCCRGPAPVDPGYFEGETEQARKNLFIQKYKKRLGRNSIVGKYSGEKRLNNLVYVENQ